MEKKPEYTEYIAIFAMLNKTENGRHKHKFMHMSERERIYSKLLVAVVNKNQFTCNVKVTF